MPTRSRRPMHPIHPSEALFQDQAAPTFLPVCDHYAGSEKMMLKAMALQTELGPLFDITFDCEDGAPVGQEIEHARLIGKLINSEANQFNRIGVRVHDFQHAFFEEDVNQVLAKAAQSLAYFVIPKVRSSTDVQAAISFINQASAKHGRAAIPIHILIETQSALAEVKQIAALDQVECLSFGIMDFVSSHWGAIPAQAMRSPAQFSHPLVMRAKLEIAAACHLHGKVASHNVTTEFQDAQCVLNDATKASRECGYSRMWSIHPNQISPIIAAMSAKPGEIEEAAELLSAAQKNQWGPIEFQGRLHDRASFRYYWMLLKKASMGGGHLPESAKAFL